jgi:DNA polymerase-1
VQLLIDTANVYARNKHKLASLSTSNGRLSGGLFGTIRSIEALVTRFAPSEVVCALEGGGRLARQALLPSYKAQRPSDRPFYDEDHRQALLEWITISGYTSAQATDGEADDVIAVLARSASIIVSTDRDYCQLLGPDCCIVSDMTKAPYRADDLVTEYGCQPQAYWMLRALSGDSSDNIPGIPGVGDRTAAKIGQVNEWNWTKILADPKVSPWRDQVELAAAVIQFRPVNVHVSSQPRELGQLRVFYQRWEFASLAKTLG